MTTKHLAPVLFLFTALVLAGCANNKPSTGITEGGHTTGYSGESAAKKQNRMQEAIDRNFRSLAY